MNAVDLHTPLMHVDCRYTPVMTSLQPVWFQQQDYATRARRIVACLVDVACLFALILASYILFSLKFVPPDVRSMPESAEKNHLIRQHLQPVAAQQSLVTLGLCIGYLGLLRKTRGGTLGRRLTRTRLIGAEGRPPAWASLGRRFLLNGLSAFIGLIPYALLAGSGKSNHPIIVFLGLILGAGFVIHLVYSSCARSPHRQALHDRWSGTWVIRAAANPAGPANRVEKAVFLGSYPLRYWELEPAEATTIPASNAQATDGAARPVTPSQAP